MIDFSGEISFKTARSGGKGGQNVNKVETSATAMWDVNASQYYTDEEKALIQEKLHARLNKDGLLQVRSMETRSQLENKEIAKAKILELVANALVKPKKRKATRPSKAAVQKRLESKKLDSLKKEMRRPPSAD